MNSGRKQPILGAFAGVVLIYFAFVLLRSVFGVTRLSVVQTRLLLSVGAVVGCVFGCQSNWNLRGLAKHVTIGVLAGVIIGLLGGVAVSEICVEYTIASVKRNRVDPFFGRMITPNRGTYRISGLVFGSVAGAVIGATLGLRSGSRSK